MSSVDGRAANISQDGLLFSGRDPIGLFEGALGPVQLEIDLPDADAPLAVAGEIRWVTDGPVRTMGIRFMQIEKLVRRRLANFVIRRACETT